MSVSGEPEMYNSIILEKNTPIPCSKTEPYSTVHDGQVSIECTVTQCTADEDNPEFVKIVQKTNLDDLPPGRPAGQEIEVTFSYDVNKMMQCEFKDVASGKSKTLDIKPDEYQETDGGAAHFEVE